MLYVGAIIAGSQLEPDAYQIMAEVEHEHWWFVGRRILAARIIESLALSS